MSLNEADNNLIVGSIGDMKNLEPLLLETISFFQPMTCTQIILQLDNEKIIEVSATLADLKQELKRLTKQGKIKQSRIGTEPVWQRVFKTRPWYQRLFV